MIAHVVGLPVEELLTPLLGGGSLLLARSWMTMRLRRRRKVRG